MADYRCPNCGGYKDPEHYPDCPTGSKKAVAAREEKEKLRRGREYWRIINAVRGNRRDHGLGEEND